MGRHKAFERIITVCLINNPNAVSFKDKSTPNIDGSLVLTIHQNDSDSFICQYIRQCLPHERTMLPERIRLYTASKGKKLSALVGVWANLGKSKLYASLDGGAASSIACELANDEEDFNDILAPNVQQSPDDTGSLRGLMEQTKELIKKTTGKFHEIDGAVYTQRLDDLFAYFKFLSPNQQSEFIDGTTRIIQCCTKALVGLIQESELQRELRILQAQFDQLIADVFPPENVMECALEQVEEYENKMSEPLLFQDADETTVLINKGDSVLREVNLEFAPMELPNISHVLGITSHHAPPSDQVASYATLLVPPNGEISRSFWDSFKEMPAEIFHEEEVDMIT